jgi:hypothetical protein
MCEVAKTRRPSPRSYIQSISKARRQNQKPRRLLNAHPTTVHAGVTKDPKYSLHGPDWMALGEDQHGLINRAAGAISFRVILGRLADLGELALEQVSLMMDMLS